MSKPDGGPAFPVPSAEDSAATLVYQGNSGMSLRDYFIAHAPAQEIADLVPTDIKGCAEYLGILAKARGQWADAMLKERDK